MLLGVDTFVTDSINSSRLTSFWERCLNTARVCFKETSRGPYQTKFKQALKLGCAFQAWGLTAKVSTASRGGRVLRRGRLFIDEEARYAL